MNIADVASSLSTQSSRPLPKDLEAACRSLEQEFGTLVFRKMREAMVPQSSKGASGFAQDTAQGLLDSQWAQLASQGEGLGLWRTLCRELSPAVKSPAGKAEEKSMIPLPPHGISASAGRVAAKGEDTP